MRGDALQTFNKTIGPTRENLGEMLAVFRRRSIKPQSMATAKHKFQKLVFNPANQKLVDFLDEFQKLAKDAFGIAVHAIIDQIIYDKMPPHLKKSTNQAHLENRPNWHVWTDCDTPRKGIRAKKFRTSWWNSDEHLDAQTINRRQPK